MKRKHFILALVAMLWSFSFSAFAATTVTTEADLKSALATGGEVTLGADIEVAEMIEIPAGVTATLDLNGYAITSGYQAESTTKHIYPLSNYGTFTIKDSKGNGSITGRGIYNQKDATITVDGAKIIAQDWNGGAGIWCYGENSKVYLNNATIIGNTGVVSSEGYLEINGGTYTCYSGIDDEGTQVTTPTYNIRAYNGLKITDGTFTSRHGVISLGGGEGVIEGGSYTIEFASATTSNVVYVYNSAKLTINGGEFISDNTSGKADSGAAVLVDGESATLEINDGTFVGMNGMVSVNDNTVIKGGSFDTVWDSNDYGSIESAVATDAVVTVAGTTYTKTENGLVEANFVAKIGSETYETFDAAITAANEMTGDVTVEIYGEVEFVDGMELKGNYTSISFVGKADGAKITINQTAGGDYLEAHGKTVTFTDLQLAKANPAWAGNSGHMGYYFSIQGGTVTYTNCTFPNGACTSGGTAVYNDCTFENASEYGLWVYDDALVTVNGGTIDSKKGIKVYSEDETTVTSTLTVQNATFTENVTEKPAVAVGYAESITLIGNTYNNTTGVLELDSGSDADCEGVTFVAQDANGNDIAKTLTAVDRSNSNAACGVLVDGKVYTTVKTAVADIEEGSTATVTLLYASTETVELPEGVTLDKNGYTADNVTVKVSAPRGDDFTGYTRGDAIWGEVWGNASESFVIKVLDANGNVMGTTTLKNVDGIIDGDVTVTWNLKLDAASNTDGYWTMEWTTAPTIDNMPAKVALWVDGTEVSGGDVVLNGPDNANPVFAAKTDADGKILSFIACDGYNLSTAADKLVSASAAGDNIAILVAGTYKVPTGKDLTITGAVEGVVFDNIGSCNMGGANVTFNSVTFDYYPNANYNGLQHSGNLVYNNCTIDGQVFLYGQSETFNKCTFNQNSADAYNVWTYGAKAVAFNECTFNSVGKSVLVYNEGACATNLTVEKTEFNASSAVEGKAAIEIDTSLMPEGTEITVDGETTANGFAEGSVSGDTLWNDKKADNDNANGGGTTSKVTVNDVVVKEPAVTNAVAKVGDEYFKTLAEALEKVENNGSVELLWEEDATPIAMNGSVYGKNVTITGTATVDWGKGWFFVGRGGEGDATVTFDSANLTAVTSSGDIGIHVSGREKETTNKYDGTVVIKNSTIELDYLINKGEMTLDNSTLTVKYGTAIGGRPASETESGEDATATMTLKNGSKLVVNNHNGMGLGFEAIGVMNIDATSTFETTQSFLVTAKGTMNIAGSAKVAGTLTNNGAINFTADAATLTASEGLTIGYALSEDKKVVYTDGTYKVVDKAYVAQAGDVKYETLAEAIENVAEEGTVTLLSDVTLTAKIDVNKSMTLDLAGNTITTMEIVGSRVFVLDDQCMTFVLNANGGAINSADAKAYGIIDVNTAADVTVNDGNYDFDTDNGGLFKFRSWQSSITLNDVNVETNAQVSGPSNALNELVVKGGTFKSVNTYNAHNYFAFYVSQATATFKDVTIENEYVGAIECSGGNVTVTNCDISVTGTHSAPYLSAAVAVSGGGKVTVDGGTYTTQPAAASDANGQGNSHGSWTMLIMSSGGTMTINDGTFSNGVFEGTPSNPRGLFSIGADADYGDNVAARLEINGGTFSSIGAFVDCETIWGSETDEANTYMPTMDVVITDGNCTDVNGEIIGGCDPISTTNPVEVAISGGTFSSPVAEEYCAAGFIPTANEDGTYGVKPGVYVAQVGEVKYESLAEAINAAESGSTVTVLADAIGAGAVINKNVTIDFNGNTYTFNEGVGSGNLTSNGFQILQGNTVTLKNGTLNVNAADAAEFYTIIQNYANLTVEDMTLDGTNLDKWSATDGDSYVLSNNSGNVVIKGNTNITANDEGDKAFAFDVCKYQSYDAPVVTVTTTGKIDGKIEVSEGLEANLVIYDGVYTQDVTEYCVSGFVCKQNTDGTYGIVKGYHFVDGQFEAYTNTEDMYVDVVSYTRDSIPTTWAAFYFPFEVPVSQLAEQGFEVAYINGVRRNDTDFDGELDKFEMEVIYIHGGETCDGSGKTLKANYPYFIRAKEEAKNLEIVLEGATLYAAENATYDCTTFTEKFVITGNTSRVTAADFGENRVNNYAVNEGSWYAFGETASLKPFRFYMTVSSRNGSEPVIMTSMSIAVRGEEREDGTTLIYDVEMDGEQPVNYIYDLQGRRVLEPQKGGLYIVNGKKVVIK